ESIRNRAASSSRLLTSAPPQPAKKTVKAATKADRFANITFPSLSDRTLNSNAKRTASGSASSESIEPLGPGRTSDFCRQEQKRRRAKDVFPSRRISEHYSQRNGTN